MDELIKLVVQQTRLPEAQAKAAVETVIGFLKERLPAPIASQLDGILGGAAASADLGNLVQGLGGLLGKK